MAVLITCMHAILVMLSAKAIGVSLRFDFALLALSSGVFIGGVIPSPGGLGAVEAGIAGALILLGLDETQAISIAIIYRVATYWQPLIPGVISYYICERKNYFNFFGFFSLLFGHTTFASTYTSKTQP